MNLDGIRNWGIAVSATLIIGALVIAAQPMISAEAQPAATVAQPSPPTQPTPVAFIVRFQGRGPIARAQASAARGRLAEAQRQVQIQLERQTAFVGLCFDRFTLGGAEIVLRTCDGVAASERVSVQQQWLARLRAMRAVAYVDANATASAERAPG